MATGHKLDCGRTVSGCGCVWSSGRGTRAGPFVLVELDAGRGVSPSVILIITKYPYAVASLTCRDTSQCGHRHQTELIANIRRRQNSRQLNNDHITGVIDALMQSIIQTDSCTEGTGSPFTHPELLGPVEVILVEVYEI